MKIIVSCVPTVTIMCFASVKVSPYTITDTCLCMCVYLCYVLPCRPCERCRPSCLLGAWPGHPVLSQLPARVHCQAVKAPLPCLWPRSVWWLLPGASAGSIAGLGPPCAGVRQLQPETWRTLTGTAFLPQSTRENHSLTQLAVCHCFTSVNIMVLSCICGKEVFRHK